MSELNREVFEQYEKEVEKLALIIKEEVQDTENTLNGREWCEENNIPENAFADAIDWNYEWFDYGVSPMYPWSTGNYE